MWKVKPVPAPSSSLHAAQEIYSPDPLAFPHGDEEQHSCAETDHEGDNDAVQDDKGGENGDEKIVPDIREWDDDAQGRGDTGTGMSGAQNDVDETGVGSIDEVVTGIGSTDEDVTKVGSTEEDVTRVGSTEEDVTRVGSTEEDVTRVGSTNEDLTRVGSTEEEEGEEALPGMTLSTMEPFAYIMFIVFMVKHLWRCKLLNYTEL